MPRAPKFVADGVLTCDVMELGEADASGRRAVVFNIIAICFKVAEWYAPASIFTLGAGAYLAIAPDDTFQHPASY